MDGALAKLHGADREETETFLDVGRYFLERFFAADEDLVASKSPAKPVTFAAVCEAAKADTYWTENEIVGAVRGAVVARKLRPDVASKLSPGFLTQLYSIENDIIRTRLAEQIASRVLWGRAARDAITRASMKEAHGGRGIPRPSPMRTFGRMLRILKSAEKLGQFDPASLTLISNRSLHEGAARSRELAKKLLEYADLLDKSRR